MKEWYLLTSDIPPNSIGGFESESFNDYKNDAFCEALQTDIATTVVLYNSDLSECQYIRCIIQGNTADTKLKSMERIGLFKCGTVKAGLYIYFENTFWLITGYPGTNGIYEKATMILCQYKLCWQNASDKIIERWCNGTSASKYDIGENGNNTITLSSNTFTLLLPYDNEVIDLDGKRVFIDKRTENPTKVYKVTRSDDILYDYGEHGCILSFIADKTEFNQTTDNQELRICDYHSPTPQPNETSDLFATISGGSTLRCGRSKSWHVTFKDASGIVTSPNFEWNIVGDADIIQKKDSNQIQLRVDDEQLIGCSFLLQIVVDNKVINENLITITEGL